jgi:hypothetical protein
MAQLKDFIRPSIVVRNIMRAHGRLGHEIWTNRYDKFSSVKCYAEDEGLGAILDEEMVNEINNALTLMGVVDFRVRRCNNSKAPPSIIVRIPHEPADLHSQHPVD